MAKIAPEAWSLVKSGAELTANYDILVSARSHSYLDGKSNTRLFGLAGESFVVDPGDLGFHEVDRIG